MDLWVRSVGDIRSLFSGLELIDLGRYENESALADIHRSTPEYKAMRKGVVDEELYDTKTRILIFQEPAISSGFLTKDDESMVFSATVQPYVVVTKYTTSSDRDTDELMGKLSNVADACRQEKEVLTFFPMKRLDEVDTEITVFERYTSEDGYKAVSERLESFR